MTNEPKDKKKKRERPSKAMLKHIRRKNLEARKLNVGES
jgi:hypothetical protein